MRSSTLLLVLGAVGLASCSDSPGRGPEGGSGGSSGSGASGGTGPVGTVGGSASSSGGAGGSPLASGGTSSGGLTVSGGTDGSGGSTQPDPTCAAGVWDGSTPQVLSLSGNTFAHDPTMIESNGVFYRFWTGNYIPSASSTNLTNWQNAASVYGSNYPSWVQTWLDGVSGETFNFPWAPDVSFFGGKHHIYSSFSAKFGDNISCITHLTSDDIAAGDWTDHGPIYCTNGSENHNAIDADVGIDAAGTPWLVFGSFWDGIFGMRLTSEGNRADTQLTRLAWANQIEAPVLFRRCNYYYLFMTWGLCCPGEGRTVDQLTYRVAVGRSTNVLGPYVDKTGKALLEGGGTLLVEGDGVTWAAAGHSDVLVSGDKIYQLYHAYRQSDGGAQLRIIELPFDEDGWPVAGGP